MLPREQGRGFARPFAWVLALVLAISAWAAHAATIQYVYDELGRLVAEIDPAGGATQYIYDAAGNLLSVTRSSSTQASIVSFTPTHGKVGDSVTIFGTGFIANPSQNLVSFAGTPALATAATTTSLVTAIPAGAVTGAITVTNANGSATSAQVFTVISPPIITAVSPATLARGFTTRAEISGSNLKFATSVTFAQAGITAEILPGATHQLLPVNIVVSAAVPAGSYGFSVTNASGTTSSGTVTVTVGIASTGDVMTVTQPVSVFLPSPPQVAPSGDSVSVAQSVSVFLPSPPQVAPSGDSMSVAQPVSVFLPSPPQVAPSGDSMSVTQPVSVSMP